MSERAILRLSDYFLAVGIVLVIFGLLDAVFVL
jgi:hypothetical protein